MGTAYYRNFGNEEMCGVYGDIADVCQLAIDGNEAALSELHVSTIEEALAAMDFCRRSCCDNHELERDARYLLDRVLGRMLEDAQIEEEKHERPGCPSCAGGCNICLGL